VSGIAAGSMKYGDYTGASKGSSCDRDWIGRLCASVPFMSKVAEGIVPSNCPGSFGGKEADWYEVGG